MNRNLIKECVHSTTSECLKWNHHTIISLLTACTCGIISFRELLISLRNTDRFLVKLFVCAMENVGEVVDKIMLVHKTLFNFLTKKVFDIGRKPVVTLLVSQKCLPSISSIPA